MEKGGKEKKVKYFSPQNTQNTQYRNTTITRQPTYVNKGPHLIDQIMQNNIFERSWTSKFTMRSPQLRKDPCILSKRSGKTVISKEVGTLNSR